MSSRQRCARRGGAYGVVAPDEADEVEQEAHGDEEGRGHAAHRRPGAVICMRREQTLMIRPDNDLLRAVSTT